MTYMLTTPKMKTTIPAWSFNDSLCGPVTYTATVSGGPLPTFIFFDPTGPSLSVYSVGVTSVGPYTVAVAGTTPVYNSALSNPVIQIVVTISCAPSMVTPTSTIAPQNVFIGTQTTSVSFGAFNVQPKCPSIDVTYTASLGGAALPSFITFNPSTRNFKIDSSQVSQTGKYLVTVTGTAGSVSGSFTWQITVADSPSMSATFFSGSINLPSINAQVAAGTTKVISSTAFQDAMALASYQFIGDPTAKTFATFSNLQLTVHPGQSDNGKYVFYFYAMQGSTKYLQQVNVMVSGGTGIHVVTYLQAQISSISRTGEALIQFSAPVFNYPNASSVVNSTALKIVAGPKGLSSTQTAMIGQQLNLTWKAVDYPQNDTLRIQVTFEDPTSVSMTVSALISPL